jgi:putative transposase
MTTPRHTATIVTVARQQHECAIARGDYLATERDLYRCRGPTAIHYLDDDQRRQLAHLAHRAGWKRIARDATIATVRTLRRWYRTLIAPDENHTGGKPRIDDATVELILQMARENSWGNDAWGRRRIKGELHGLDITVSASSIRNILRRHGIPPAPQRGRGGDDPAAIISASTDSGHNTISIDFCTTTVGTGEEGSLLRRAYILIAIHLTSRIATVIGTTVAKPDADFMKHCADVLAGPNSFARTHHATNIRMDRDGIFSPAFRQRLIGTGVTIERIDAHCPWQNGHAERFIKTFKNGILRKAIWADVEGLQHACDVFINHYVTERPHQALGNMVIRPAMSCPLTGPISCRRYFGGLINHYYREAV